MEFEQYLTQEWKSVASTASGGSDGFRGCFDCNICLDHAQEPVVTLCGHLYCWPCIYKWLHVQSASLASDENPRCPVCKSDISDATVVPLYGRGRASSAGEPDGKTPSLCGMVADIPPRPPACGTQVLASNSLIQTGRQLPYRNPYTGFEEASSQSPLLDLGGSTTVRGLNQLPDARLMFREMVYSRVFGNPNFYECLNSYYQMANSYPRWRRLEMQADESLNRISIFLFCFFLLCFIVF